MRATKKVLIEILPSTLDPKIFLKKTVNSIYSSKSETTPSPPEEEEDDDESINTAELLAAVSSTAEQGIVLLYQWLGITPKRNTTTPKEDSPETPSVPQQSPQETRSARNLGDEERNEERFKQLLSAQDNIMRESARIGPIKDAQTTFIFPKTMAKSQAPVVPRESRRGGRAYNIHQHINEI